MTFKERALKHLLSGAVCVSLPGLENLCFAVGHYEGDHRFTVISVDSGLRMHKLARTSRKYAISAAVESVKTLGVERVRELNEAAKVANL